MAHIPSAARHGRRLLVLFMICSVFPGAAASQVLTGALIGTVRDGQGAVIRAASVRVSSIALIGGQSTLTTDQKGRFRFLALPPGSYALDVEVKGFAPLHENDISIGAGLTLERNIALQLTGVAESVVVEGMGSRIEARAPGFGTRFGPEDLASIPTRRNSFDFLRATPGISPTSPSSASTVTVSSFGSGTNENQFLIDGTSTTCPCNGIARTEMGVDFIQEVQVQSVGASAEFGNLQGAVVNVITKQGSARFQYDAAYYAQTAGLTSQPVLLPVPANPLGGKTGFERIRYRDLTTNLGGPVVRDRLWFFVGYQYLRDHTSQPGTDPAFPWTYEQNKIFGKLTWKLTPRLQMMHSFHEEIWVNPDPPTQAAPFEAARRRTGTVPASTIGHLTYTVSPNTLWEARVGRFVYSETRTPSTGDWTIPSRTDTVSGITTGAPPQVGDLNLIRTTAKATINHYRAGFAGADHQVKTGVQFERGEHYGAQIIPTGVRYQDRSGAPNQAIASAPSNNGGAFNTTAAFAVDQITIGDRATVDAGVRFDHSRVMSQDLNAVDPTGHYTATVVEGRGTLYTWNVWSPRLGATVKLTADGRTMLRGSYGRFVQGVLTGEVSPFHPGVSPTTTYGFDAATGGYTRVIRVDDPAINLVLDAGLRAPHTDEYAIGADREVARRLAVAIAYIRKDGRDFIGWTNVGGRYRAESRPLPNGGTIPVYVLDNSTSEQRFLLSNPDTFSLTYNGLVVAVDKRRSSGWQAFGSYTFSKVEGLQASSGEIAAAAQASTIATPTRTFGRDPNDFTNAYGRLPNDRPHMFRVMGSLDVPRTGFVVATNLQYFTGKPWAATTQFNLPQGNQRILIEPRGSRRLASQTLLDVRVSRRVSLRGTGHIDLLLDVLNALNDTAAEGIVTDNMSDARFGQPTILLDPRRAMLGVRLNLGR